MDLYNAVFSKGRTEFLVDMLYFLTQNYSSRTQRNDEDEPSFRKREILTLTKCVAGLMVPQILWVQTVLCLREVARGSFISCADLHLLGCRS